MLGYIWGTDGRMPLPCSFSRMWKERTRANNFGITLICILTCESCLAMTLFGKCAE